MSQQSQPKPGATTTKKEEVLTKEEQEEKQALEEKRKAAGDPKLEGSITDSERARLSQIYAKEAEAKEDKGTDKPK